VKRSASHRFEAPIEDVWAMFRDPASHVAKAERAGHRDVEVVEEDVTGDHVRIRLARTVTLELPGFAKKVLSPTHRVVSTDEWRDQGDGSYRGTFTTDFRGAPIKLDGRTLIAPDGPDRTVYEVDIEVAVKVPVVGKKLEAWAETDVEDQIRQEFAAGDDWLASYGA
jgi:uncharacterized protein YndB with AHSA1/START domain